MSWAHTGCNCVVFPTTDWRPRMNVSDELEIRNLIARVARLTDKWTVQQDVLKEYTADCIWHLDGTPPYYGHEGLSRRMNEVLASGICGPNVPMRHLVASL